MHTLPISVYPFAICLSALAGCVDAIGFLQLGGYFISFMSGNSTRLAVGLLTGNMQAVALLGTILACFVIGTMLGALARHFSKNMRPAVTVLALVTALLAAAALCYEGRWILPAVICMTMAMGAENAVFQRDGHVVVGLTYMTGTLVKVGQQLANALTGGPRFAWLPYLLLWLGLISGGMTGALLFYIFGLHSLCIAVLWAAGLTAVARMKGEGLG